MIDELQLVYNKARQAAITKELSEIVGGARRRSDGAGTDCRIEDNTMSTNQGNHRSVHRRGGGHRIPRVRCPRYMTR